MNSPAGTRTNFIPSEFSITGGKFFPTSTDRASTVKKSKAQKKKSYTGLRIVGYDSREWLWVPTTRKHWGRLPNLQKNGPASTLLPDQDTIPLPIESYNFLDVPISHPMPEGLIPGKRQKKFDAH